MFDEITVKKTIPAYTSEPPIPAIGRIAEVDPGTLVALYFDDPYIYDAETVPATLTNNGYLRDLATGVKNSSPPPDVGGASPLGTCGVIFGPPNDWYVRVNAAKFAAGAKHFGVGGWWKLLDNSGSPQRYTGIAAYQTNTAAANQQWGFQRDNLSPSSLRFMVAGLSVVYSSAEIGVPHHYFGEAIVDGTALTINLYVDGVNVASASGTLAGGVLPTPSADARIGAGAFGGYNDSADVEVGSFAAQRFDATDAFYNVEEYLLLAHGCNVGRFT